MTSRGYRRPEIDAGFKMKGKSTLCIIGLINNSTNSVGREQGRNQAWAWGGGLKPP